MCTHVCTEYRLVMYEREGRYGKNNVYTYIKNRPPHKLLNMGNVERSDVERIDI